MILDLIKILIAYFLAWCIGYLVMVLINKGQQFCFGCRFFAAWFLGIGLFTLQLFTSAIFGLSLTLITGLIIIAADIIVLQALIFARYKRLVFPRFKWPRILTWFTQLTTWEKLLFILMIILIVSKSSASFWQVYHSPTYEFDAWNNWNLRAKVIFSEQKIPLDRSQPFYLGGGIKSYPLNDSLWKVWLATIIGEWNENLINIHSVFIYLFLLGLFYFSFPENLRTLVKIGYIQLFATLPFLYFHSWIPYADLPFAAYLFGAVLAFIGFLKAKNQPFLVLSALFMSLAIWTKNEGFAVVLPVILAVSLLLVVTRKWKIRHFIWYWLITAFIASPWLVFRFVNKLELLSGDSSSFKLVFNWQFLGEWFSSVFLRSHFNFLYLLVFLLLILKAKAVWSNLILRYLSLILILLFLFYNGIIIFTDKAYDLGALTRVNLQIAPIAMLLLLLLLKQIFYDALWFVKKKYDQTTQD